MRGRGGRATVRDEIIDELLSGQDPQAMFAKNGLLDTLKKALAERILDHHLAGEGAQVGPETPRQSTNQRSRHRRGTADTQQRAKRIGAGLPNDG